MADTATSPGSTDLPATEHSRNTVVLRGQLTTDVRISDLPDGRSVRNFELRADAAGERHVVPVAWHDPSRPPRLEKGDEVVVTGAVRRRWFRAGGGSQSRTEVLADCVARAGTARATKAVAEAVATLTLE